MKKSPLFSYSSVHLSDEEFWDHIQRLDEMAESTPDQEGGFAVQIQSGTGKKIDVPFVRFRKNLPDIAS